MVRCTKCGQTFMVYDNPNIGSPVRADQWFRSPGSPVYAERDGCVFCQGGDAPCGRCGERQLIPITDQTERRYLVGPIDPDRKVWRCLKCGQPHKGPKSEDLDTRPDMGGESPPSSGRARKLF